MTRQLDQLPGFPFPPLSSYGISGGLAHSVRRIFRRQPPYQSVRAVGDDYPSRQLIARLPDRRLDALPHCGRRSGHQFPLDQAKLARDFQPHQQIPLLRDVTDQEIMAAMWIKLHQHRRRELPITSPAIPCLSGKTKGRLAVTARKPSYSLLPRSHRSGLVPSSLAQDLLDLGGVLKPGGRVAVSDIALKKPLPAKLERDVMANVGCISGAIQIEDYKAGLLRASFGGVHVVDSGSDLNAHSKVGGQWSCCVPPMTTVTLLDSGSSCCGGTSWATATSDVHAGLSMVLE